MYDVYADIQDDREDLVVELAEAAYGFALRHGFRGTFIEVELGLWHALRSCVHRHAHRGGARTLACAPVLSGADQEFASASLPTGSSSGPDLRVPPPTRQGTHDVAAPALARH
jgi:hypothetical protein